MKNLTKIALIGSLALAGALGTHYTLNNASNTAQVQEVITEANKRLRHFPNKVNGAKEITKYETPGAKYTLVHLKQTHFGLEKELSLEKILKSDPRYLDKIQNLYRNINDCQKDVYDILTELIKAGQISTVRAEGIMIKDSFEDERFLRHLYFSDLEALDKENYFDGGIKNAFKTINHLQPYVEKNQPRPFSSMEETLAEYNKAREYFEKFKYIPGGHNLLAVEDKLKMLPAEKLEAYKTDDSNLREDALLEIISQGKNPFELAVYGSTHDFNDNIMKWNEKYPDKKYSLIEITPINLNSNNSE